MLVKHIILSLVFIVLFGTIPSFGQSKSEKKLYKVPCFNKKVEVLISHSSIGSDDGEIEVKLPVDSDKIKLTWGYGYGSFEGKHIKNLSPDYYHLIIMDLESQCQAIIGNIQLKELPKDE